MTAKSYRQSGRLINSLDSHYSTSVGDNLFQWDDRGVDGSCVDDGPYIVLVEAEGERAQRECVVFDQ